LGERRRAVAPGAWTWLRQVHGDGVVTVTAPGEGAGRDADAAVTAVPGAVLAVGVADCAPVLLTSPDGVVGAVHAGWRGVAAGVVERAVAAMAALGAGRVDAVVGPCIGPECYEFGADDLAQVVAALGPSVAAATAAGRPALDLVAAVRVAAARAGVATVDAVGRCTACEPGAFFSHRARRDAGRQVGVVWLAAA
ncbi:MAG TPA: laccase domain-containing protein, partial [Acidimicrobiales bacterium]